MIVEKAELLAWQMKKLRNAGYDLRETSDFDEVEAIIERLGKPYLTPHLDPSKNDFTPANCFWIVVERLGCPVALGGVRLDDMGHDASEQILRRMYSRHYPGGLVYISPSVVAALRGKVCYVGDLYLSPDVRGQRELLSSSMTICHLIINLKWQPDLTYAFLHQKHVRRGAAILYGFQTAIPFSKEFAASSGPRADDEVFATLSNDQLECWVRSEVRSLKFDDCDHRQQSPIEVAGN